MNKHFMFRNSRFKIALFILFGLIIGTLIISLISFYKPYNSKDLSDMQIETVQLQTEKKALIISSLKYKFNPIRINNGYYADNLLVSENTLRKDMLNYCESHILVTQNAVNNCNAAYKVNNNWYLIYQFTSILLSSSFTTILISLVFFIVVLITIRGLYKFILSCFTISNFTKIN